MIKYFVIPVLIIALGCYLIIWFDGREGWVPHAKRLRQRTYRRYGIYFTCLGIVSLLTTIAILWNQY